MNVLINPFDAPELRFEIALQTPIEDLPTLCSQDKDYAKICNDERFWKQRLIKDYDVTVPYDNMSYKETYRVKRNIESRARRFGYYPDDVTTLLKFPYKLSDHPSLYNHYRRQPNSRGLVITPEYIVKYNVEEDTPPMRGNEAMYGQSYKDKYKPRTFPLIDVIIHQGSKFNQINFVSQCLKALNLDRLIVTFAEAVDILYYALGSDGNNYVKNPTRTSILSSLNKPELLEYMNQQYSGFPDYPSVLQKAVQYTTLSRIWVVEGPVTPDTFNMDRYNYIKRFDMIKILNLLRAYKRQVSIRSEETIESYPPYLLISCIKGDANFEQLLYAMNEENYMDILAGASIRTEPKLSYEQALARLTVLYDISWIDTYYKKDDTNMIERLLRVSRRKAGRHYPRDSSAMATYLIVH